MQLSRTNQQGAALIAAIISVVIFGFGIVSLTKFQNNLFENNTDAKHRVEAMQFGQEKIEQLRAYEVLNTEVGKMAFQDIATGTDSKTVISTTYNRSWTVTDSADGSYKSVDVVVAWAALNGVSKTVNINGKISKVDPADSGLLISSVPSSAGSIAPN